MSGSGELRLVFTVFSLLTMSIYTRHCLEPGGKLTQLQHFTGHVSQTALTWPRVWLGGCVITLTSHSSLYVTSPCCCRAHTESHGVLEVAGSGPAPAAPGTSFTWALALAQPSPAQPSPTHPSRIWSELFSWVWVGLWMWIGGVVEYI